MHTGLKLVQKTKSEIAKSQNPLVTYIGVPQKVVGLRRQASLVLQGASAGRVQVLCQQLVGLLHLILPVFKGSHLMQDWKSHKKVCKANAQMQPTSPSDESPCEIIELKG